MWKGMKSVRPSSCIPTVLLYSVALFFPFRWNSISSQPLRSQCWERKQQHPVHQVLLFCYLFLGMFLQYQSWSAYKARRHILGYSKILIIHFLKSRLFNHTYFNMSCCYVVQLSSKAGSSPERGESSLTAKYSWKISLSFTCKSVSFNTCKISLAKWSW